MRDPDFFIIGAPKCGTTALSEYLREHSRVFMTDPKEPFFYCEDFPSRRKFTDESEYMSLYRHATEEHLAVGEGSVHYLRSAVAVPTVLQRFPDARFIVMLRDPVDFLVSYHSQMLRSLTEDVVDFEDAWNLNEQRRAGKQLPRNCNEPAFVDYKSAASFGGQVDRLMKRVAAERVLFVRFDEFVKNTRQEYERVLGFLSVPAMEQDEFPKVNSRAALRSRKIGRVHQGLHKMRVAMGISEQSRFRRVVLKPVSRTLRRLNQSLEDKPRISNSLIREIRQELRGDVELLASHTGWDLAAWAGHPASAESDTSLH